MYPNAHIAKISRAMKTISMMYHQLVQLMCECVCVYVLSDKVKCCAPNMKEKEEEKRKMD